MSDIEHPLSCVILSGAKNHLPCTHVWGSHSGERFFARVILRLAQNDKGERARHPVHYAHSAHMYRDLRISHYSLRFTFHTFPPGCAS
jgi:hypothetical protein